MAYEDDLPTDPGFEPEEGWDGETDPTVIPGGEDWSDQTGGTLIPEGRKDIDNGTIPEFRDDEDVKGILMYSEGNRRGHTLKLWDGTVVGREEGDIALGDVKISNPHAKFRIEDEVFVLWDFGSTNGTYVNGEKILCATELEENDEIRFGDQVFLLKVLMPPTDKQTNKGTSTTKNKSTKKRPN